MAIPIGDDNSDRRTTPVVNYLLIAFNIFVFFYWQQLGHNVPLTFAYAAVPREILTDTDIVTNSQVLTDPYTGQAFELPGLQPTPIPVFFTLFTSMFLHGGFAHLFGNMLYLWIFGDNVEDALGHFRYLIFYLLCGLWPGFLTCSAPLYWGKTCSFPHLVLRVLFQVY